MKRKNIFILPLGIMVIGYAIATVQETHLGMAVLFCGSVMVAWLCGLHTTYMINEGSKSKRHIDSFIYPGDVIEITFTGETRTVTVLALEIDSDADGGHKVLIRFRDHAKLKNYVKRLDQIKYLRHISKAE